MKRIAVIGAGLAGLTVARDLSTSHDVVVFEKSRGVGGRMATRYADDFEFDHGAQFFTVKSSAFRAFLQPMIENGVVRTWSARFAELERGRIAATRQWDDEYPHYVGAPRMNAVGKWLANGLDIRLQSTVVRLARNDCAWTLIDDKGEELGRYDWVVSAVPAPQTTALLGEASSIGTLAESARMQGCVALMLGFDTAPDLPWQAALVRGADISWISVNSSKPGRRGPFCMTVHSTNAWADAHIDDDEELQMRHLVAECADVVGDAMTTPAFQRLHRWRFANIEAQDTADFGIDADLQLAACGDWFIRGRVEAAFRSARALSNAMQARR